jgi:molybdopterin/thiamine biosynthesis adenylyltransferase
MPEADGDAQEDIVHTTLGAAIVDRWPGATLLHESELKARFPARLLGAGWRLPDGLIQGNRLLLLLPNYYPYALPLVALADQPPLATLPHVEEDGVFCIASSGSLMVLPADIRHAEYVVDEAIKIYDAGVNGKNHRDFLDEASTYWCLGQSGGQAFWLTIMDYTITRLIQSKEFDAGIVFAENADAIKKWAERGTSSKQPIDGILPAGLIFLPFPLFPKDYPHQTDGLVALVTRAGRGAIDVLGKLLKPGRTSCVIFAFEHGRKIILLGLTVKVGTKIGGGRKGLPLWHGFREGKVPTDVMLDRIAAARFPLIRSRVDRVDSAALLRRTTGASADTLTNVSVAIIGCGALGGVVAQLLAQAGVRRITLIDGDALNWQNVGRHVLPGSYVGSNKAKAMRRHLLDRFPEYDIEAVANRWQDAWKTNSTLLNKYDLVISVTGDWVSDCLLNDLCKDDLQISAVIFGWVEAHAIAGHALIVLPEGGCLRCTCNEVGEFLNAVAEVPQEQALRRESSCGAFYQPFSAAAAMPTASLIVKTAIDALTGRVGQSEHRVWIGAKEDFDAVDASIKHTWDDKLTMGGWERIYRMLLHEATGCPICGIEG